MAEMYIHPARVFKMLARTSMYSPTATDVDHARSCLPWTQDEWYPHVTMVRHLRALHKVGDSKEAARTVL